MFTIGKRRAGGLRRGGRQARRAGVLPERILIGQRKRGFTPGAAIATGAAARVASPRWLNRLGPASTFPLSRVVETKGGGPFCVPVVDLSAFY